MVKSLALYLSLFCVIVSNFGFAESVTAAKTKLDWNAKAKALEKLTLQDFVGLTLVGRANEAPRVLEAKDLENDVAEAFYQLNSINELARAKKADPQRVAEISRVKLPANKRDVKFATFFGDIRRQRGELSQGLPLNQARREALIQFFDQFIDDTYEAFIEKRECNLEEIFTLVQVYYLHTQALDDGYPKIRPTEEETAFGLSLIFFVMQLDPKSAGAGDNQLVEGNDRRMFSGDSGAPAKNPKTKLEKIGKIFYDLISTKFPKK